MLRSRCHLLLQCLLRQLRINDLRGQQAAAIRPTLPQFLAMYDRPTSQQQLLQMSRLAARNHGGMLIGMWAGVRRKPTVAASSACTVKIANANNAKLTKRALLLMSIRRRDRSTCSLPSPTSPVRFGHAPLPLLMMRIGGAGVLHGLRTKT